MCTYVCVDGGMYVGKQIYMDICIEYLHVCIYKYIYLCMDIYMLKYRILCIILWSPNKLCYCLGV